MAQSDVLWSPPADVRARTRMGQFLSWLEQHRGLSFATYDDLWRWSVEDLEGFWSAVWEFFEIVAHHPYDAVLADPSMPAARWFTGATLNYAEHALRNHDDPVVLRSYSQSRPPMVLTGAELRAQVAAVRAGLVRLGVKEGDRVAAYLPNIAETVVAFLASASLGAVWASCAPEFGIRSVVERFSQIEPSLLLVVDGYRYGDKVVDRVAEVNSIREALPSLKATVVVPYLHSGPDRIAGAVLWDALAAPSGPVGQLDAAEFHAVSFDHPLYILFSSGTTGLPKPIVHSHGGILIEHLKVLGLHADLGPGDRFFWFSTTGWMMWNFLVSGLLVGSEVVLLDGDPAYPDLLSLWNLAADTALTYFGTSAPFLLSCRSAGVRPGETADLSALRTIGSTGAPLPAEGFEWVYDAVKRDVVLSSISGGTDVCTAFVGGMPMLPVRSGEITCRYLGCKVEAYGPDGRPRIGSQGELVITAPMPSMPIGFWGDENGSRYRSAYFDTYPGVWRHGDWITITDRGSCIITGRSDATLNRGGVRIGTSDFYAVVEELPEIADSLVVHVDPGGDSTGWLVLFVVLAPNATLDDRLHRKIVDALRTNLSPRHVPDMIEQVPSVPRTLSGKKLEVPVKRILAGEDAEAVVARGALANPESLTAYELLARHPPWERR